MNLSKSDYKDKVMGCWMGKNIGGTLGAPFEWRRQVNDVSFYTQDLGGEPLPNDDLDIQLLWLVALEEKGVKLDAHTLAEYWCLYVTPHWSEYGTAKINMRRGLVPPLCGTFGNDFKDSCGAFIRSEIWACIAPGDPATAAWYAMQDAMLDHGDGEGTYAAIFTAALESAAFSGLGITDLIDVALSYIPPASGVAGAVRKAMEAHSSGLGWLEARDAVLDGFRGGAFFGYDWAVSARDKEKGFDTGKLGWDAPSNIGMIVVGLLYGEGNFDKTMSITVNCGEDTDCTAATVGSIFGILHGMGQIPERWISPIGHKIKTACLNLGELGYFGNQLPQDIEGLTDRTMRARGSMALARGGKLRISEDPTDLSDVGVSDFLSPDKGESLAAELSGPIYRFFDLDVAVGFAGSEPVIREGQATDITLRINNTYKTQAALFLRWYSPEGITVTPASGSVMSLPPHFHKSLVVNAQVRAERLDGPNVRLVLEITAAGRPTAYHVPILLLNGSMI